MQVTAEPFIGTGVMSKQPVRFDQYMIRVDGLVAGYLGTKPGSKLCLITRFTPLEVAEIEKQLQGLPEQGEINSTMVPEPSEQVEEQDETEIHDDFDA